MPERMEPIKEIWSEPALSIEKLKANISESDARRLKTIEELFGQKKEGVVALVGGGPSLSKQLNKIEEYENVIICGSAHDYMMTTLYRYMNEVNIPLHQMVYCVICDPDPIMAEYIQHWSPEVTYLIASQCDKEVFETLKDAPRKYIWDCAGYEQFNRETFKTPEKLIIGGCTVGTRAMGMAIAMGFKKMHLFGYDSCLTNEYKHHAYKFHNPERETLGNITEIRLNDPVNGKKFICAGYMVAQILDFQWMLRNFADQLDIKVFGDGALAYILEKGYENMLKLKEERKNGTRS
jgi:hypothetical protein